MPPEGEVGVDTILQRGQAQLIHAPNRCLCEGLEREVCEGGAAPETQRLAQLRRGLLRSPSAERGAAVAEELLEPIQVDLIGVEPDEVAGTLSDEDLARRAEQLAQLRHVDLDRVGGRRRRLLAPELVDQAIGRDDLIRVEDQDDEQRSPLRAAELERPPVRRRPPAAQGCGSPDLPSDGVQAV